MLRKHSYFFVKTQTIDKKIFASYFIDPDTRVNKQNTPTLKNKRIIKTLAEMVQQPKMAILCL